MISDVSQLEMHRTNGLEGPVPALKWLGLSMAVRRGYPRQC